MLFKKQKIHVIFLSIITAIALMACGSTGAGSDSDSDLDTTSPTVTSTIAADGATDVAINSDIYATFSEAMAPATITATSFTLKHGTTAVTGTVSYTDETATFNPDEYLADSTVYTATITTVATNLAGIALAQNKVWTFTTSGPDTTAPTVISTSPVNNATNVAINSNITAMFSEVMEQATIVAANFTLSDGATSVSGTVIYDIGNMAAVFAPDANLNGLTEYTATLTTAVKDLAGNAMASNEVWTFTTAAEGSGPSPVSLGTAGNFAILSKAGISTVPASAITGNIGVSPAAETYLTGFSQTKATGYSTSPQVTGYLYAADMTPPTPSNMTTAISDMETAYTDAAGRPTPDFTDLGSAGEIGGETLSPGLYKWTAGVIISTDVTINGAANDVWILQIPGNLTVANGVRVNLSGGAQARNIFWQVAGEVTLGTTAHFEGILLCSTAIVLQTGATMNGRALAQTEVTLDESTVVEPTQ